MFTCVESTLDLTLVNPNAQNSMYRVSVNDGILISSSTSFKVSAPEILQITESQS